MTWAERMAVKKKKGSGTCQGVIYGNSSNAQPRSFVSCPSHVSNGGCSRIHWEQSCDSETALIIPFLCNKNNTKLPPKLWQCWHTQQYHMAAASICCVTGTGLELPFLLVNYQHGFHAGQIQEIYVTTKLHQKWQLNSMFSALYPILHLSSLWSGLFIWTMLLFSLEIR